MQPLKHRKFRILFAIVALMAAFAGPAGAATIGASLQDSLATLKSTDTVEVIVSFHGDGAPTATQIEALENLGLAGIHLRALPMAGVVATPAQVEQLDALDSVRSLWLNERLEYDNDLETALTGVDRLQTDPNLRSRTGLPYSGKGVGVLVNDSGIDGNHPDLQFGSKVVQNVLGQVNLHAQDSMLPITYVEGVPDSDIAGGHGTHVAGTIGGTGSASGGTEAGVAPGADIVGYGSGAGVFILDTLGGFDYALVNQFRYNIRVVSNSFGSPSDTGTDFNPDDPTNIATKALADRNIVVVFSAGNSGSGEDTITGNFKKAPWVVTVGAGSHQGTLADFSSRGKRDGGGDVTIGGQTYTWVDRPNIVAPGVDVISAQAKTDPLAAGDGDTDVFYTTLSGTSMAAPHTSGIVALMLEANPSLHWSDVIRILEETATNMPGRDPWEVGAGYINAHAAVAAAAGARDDYGQTQTLGRDFNAGVLESRLQGPDFELFFSPVVLEPDVETFTVSEGLSTVIASANVSENTVAIVVTDPNGNRYGSAISLPLLGPSIAVTAPAVPGEWTVEIRGIGSVSGVALDPLGLTNGTAAPGTIPVDVDFIQVDGFFGLNDVAGHPARGLIEHAVAERLVDARAGGFYEPDALLTRGELADYLTLGDAIRQFRPTDGTDSILDADGLTLAAAEAVTARGAAIRDLRHVQGPVVRPAADGAYDPAGTVSRAELAYSLVQALGLEEEAGQVDGELTVAFKGERIPLEDGDQVPGHLRGHVQLALDLQLMRAEFSLEQGPFELEPTIKARFNPADAVTRAAYAFNAVNWLDRIRQAE